MNLFTEKLLVNLTYNYKETESNKFNYTSNFNVLKSFFSFPVLKEMLQDLGYFKIIFTEKCLVNFTITQKQQVTHIFFLFLNWKKGCRIYFDTVYTEKQIIIHK